MTFYGIYYEFGKKWHTLRIQWQLKMMAAVLGHSYMSCQEKTKW